jgi:hypothetical protein
VVDARGQHLAIRGQHHDAALRRSLFSITAAFGGVNAPLEEMRFEPIDRRIVVPVSIGDKENLRFVPDTGAPELRIGNGRHEALLTVPTGDDTIPERKEKSQPVQPRQAPWATVRATKSWRVRRE